MGSREDWIVVAGFLLAACGLFLRIFLMLRASDAQPVNEPVKGARQLLRSFGSRYPKSRLAFLMWICLSAGPALPVAGFLLEFR